MNFNLALICADGRFADARAFCTSCSLSPSGRNSHSASDSGVLGAAFSLRRSRDTSLGLAPPPCLKRPKIPRKWVIVWEIYRVYISAAVFKDPSNLGWGWRAWSF